MTLCRSTTVRRKTRLQEENLKRSFGISFLFDHQSRSGSVRGEGAVQPVVPTLKAVGRAGQPLTPFDSFAFYDEARSKLQEAVVNDHTTQ